jgi:hypothetical protein
VGAVNPEWVVLMRGVLEIFLALDLILGDTG